LKLLESGQSIEAVSALTGVSASTLYEWIGQRKKEVGLVNRHGQGGGAKPRLSKEQKQEFKELLQSQPNFYTIGRMRNLAREHFGVSYGWRQMQRLARQLGMYCYKAQPRDYRQPANAPYKLKEKIRAVADVLGMKGRDLDKLCIGFADESSSQLHANSTRLWSFDSGLVKQVNTDKKKRNCFGFYALKGCSVLNFIAKGNQETMSQMLAAIRAANAEAETIVVVWDNHRAHLTASVEAKALELGIVLVNLAGYSPNLNPIERIWKQIKKAISEQALITTVEQLEKIIQTTFESCCNKLSFAKSWIKNIYNQAFVNYPIPISDML